jgi:hypothetical protein
MGLEMVVHVADEDLISSAPEDHTPFVTVTSGMRGYFAILMFWDEDGFWDVWQSGIGSYRTAEEARKDAREWAHAEGIRCEEQD